MIISQDLNESKKNLNIKEKILIVFMQLKTSLNPVLVLCTLHISLNISPDFESGMAFRSNQFLQIYKYLSIIKILINGFGFSGLWSQYWRTNLKRFLIDIPALNSIHTITHFLK